MKPRHRIPFLILIALAPAIGLGGCLDGSGSQGFDITSERAAITSVLQTRQCVDYDGLRYCPAEQPDGLPPTPDDSGEAMATPPAGEEDSTPSPTPTALPMGVDVFFSGSDSPACAGTPPEGSCRYDLFFLVVGDPALTSFRIALREIDASSGEALGAWTLSAPATRNETYATGGYDTSLETPPYPGSSDPAPLLQLAVLGYYTDQGAAGEELATLGASGAGVAWITQPRPRDDS